MERVVSTHCDGRKASMYTVRERCARAASSRQHAVMNEHIITGRRLPQEKSAGCASKNGASPCFLLKTTGTARTLGTALYNPTVNRA
jgi:hypothetical protein